jgi:hypothetical protein
MGVVRDAATPLGAVAAPALIGSTVKPAARGLGAREAAPRVGGADNRGEGPFGRDQALRRFVLQQILAWATQPGGPSSQLTTLELRRRWEVQGRQADAPQIHAILTDLATRHVVRLYPGLGEEDIILSARTDVLRPLL